MITNFGTLKTDIASWMNRTNLTSVIPNFVQIAEANIRRDLEVRTQELTATGTLSSGVLAFPARYSETRRLKVNNRVMEYVTPERYTNKDFEDTGTARYYTIIGESILVLDGGSGSYELVYSQWFASLSADADTNWVIANAPDVYLWGSCAAGEVYLKNPDGAATFKGMYDMAVRDLQNKEKAAKYSGAPLQVRSQVAER